ncbi:hypothetical protein ACHAXN_008801 [Cyclotella atomus]
MDDGWESSANETFGRILLPNSLPLAKGYYFYQPKIILGCHGGTLGCGLPSEVGRCGLPTQSRSVTIVSQIITSPARGFKIYNPPLSLKQTFAIRIGDSGLYQGDIISEKL